MTKQSKLTDMFSKKKENQRSADHSILDSIETAAESVLDDSPNANSDSARKRATPEKDLEENTKSKAKSSAKKLKTNESLEEITGSPDDESSGGSDLEIAFGASSWKEILGEEWFTALEKELAQPYVERLVKKVAAARASSKVYPPPKLTFTAFQRTPLSSVRVVLIGQDPYHQPNQAMGLSFSVFKGVKIPPSLRNIYKEQQQNPSHGDLTSWSEQGVFLLNALLTVPDSTPLGHKDFEWEKFTDAVVKVLIEREKGSCFMLWGAYAQKKGAPAEKKKQHCVLKAGHPSPLSVRHFLGCDHFNKCNQWIKNNGSGDEINWMIE